MLVSSLCHPGMVAFDVGAHAGYFTLLLSSAVGPTGKVFAFEPDPSNLAVLEHHMQINGLTNVSIVPAAVSNQDGQTAFECSASMGRIAASGSTLVRTMRLDQLPSPDLIKMDIEGGEGDALDGARRILSECHAVWLIALHDDQEAICVALLEGNGYRVRHIDPAHVLAEPKC
jgi:FkbM family methyltransferase